MMYLALLVGTLVFPPVCVWLIRANAVDAQRRLTYRDDFYRASMKLVDAPEDAVPPQTLYSIMLLSRLITDKRCARLFVWHVATGGMSGRGANKAKLLLHMEDLSDELRDIYSHALVSFVFAITYNNVVIGRFARRFLMWGVNPKAPSHRALIAAADLAQSRRCDDYNGPDGRPPSQSNLPLGAAA
jgi:hypothetical protein